MRRREPVPIHAIDRNGPNTATFPFSNVADNPEAVSSALGNKVLAYVDGTATGGNLRPGRTYTFLAVVKELNTRGWRTKRWTTRKESVRGGRRFDKTSLHQLLTNVAYAGKVRYKDEVHAGEHKAIVDAKVFDRVQVMLQRNGRSGGRGVRAVKRGANVRRRRRPRRGLMSCATLPRSPAWRRPSG